MNTPDQDEADARRCDHGRRLVDSCALCNRTARIGPGDQDAELEALETPLTIGDVIHALEAAREAGRIATALDPGLEAMLSAAIRSLLEGVGMDEEEDEEEEPTP